MSAKWLDREWFRLQDLGRHLALAGSVGGRNGMQVQSETAAWRPYVRRRWDWCSADGGTDNRTDGIRSSDGVPDAPDAPYGLDALTPDVPTVRTP